MTKKSALPGTRRTKAERTKALAAVFKQAGFTRKGADWYLEQGDLLWNTSLDSYRRPEEDEIPFDVFVNASYLPARTSENEDACVLNVYMGRLPGTRSDPAFNNAYREYDTEDSDPLVRDAGEFLVPLIKRMRTVEDVLDACLSGELSSKSWSQTSRIVGVFNTARRLQRLDYVQLAQRAVDEGRWTYDDRINLEHFGLKVPRETRIPEDFFERIRRWAGELRDRSWHSL